MTQLTVERIADSNQQRIDDEVFPLLLQAPKDAAMDAVLDWVVNHRQALQSQLSQHGAIILRGFGIADSDQFDRLIRAFDWPNFTSVSYTHLRAHET